MLPPSLVAVKAPTVRRSNIGGCEYVAGCKEWVQAPRHAETGESCNAPVRQVARALHG